ncbi:RNA-directed DNA polymerase, eukaryota [Tanacetum coccineum]
MGRHSRKGELLSDDVKRRDKMLMELLEIEQAERNSSFQKIDRCDSELLEAPINMEEIKLAVWSCSSCKSPGPDGLNFKLIKRYWKLFKDNFFKCINHFENTGMLTKGCNASFIVLIPKNLDPLEMGDYRPISLIVCVYKVISKVLSSRLAKVIHKLIMPNQTAFIAGRQILDGCLIANEIVKFAKKEGIELLLFKVDFEKAFDSINWKFMFDVMRQMGFGSKWCKWIKACLSSASVSVLVNGSPTDKFQMERGIRQGDPLSPFLFLLVAEALQVLILEACNKSVSTGLFLDNDGSNVSLLQLYGVGVDPAQVEIVANAINYVHDKLPFVYLGIPIGSNMRTIPLYYLSLFKAPSLVLDHLEYVRRRFFWGINENEKKIIWVNWKKVCVSKIRGGLGLGRLKDKNMSLLGKWKWRFCNEDNALWQKVIKEIYGPHGGFESNNSSNMSSGVWKSISSNCKGIELLNIPFEKSMIKEVSSGSQTHFWSDIWCKEESKTTGLGETNQNFIWNSWVPRKVNIFIWRASMDRLPSRASLLNRGVEIADARFMLCDMEIEVETAEHCTSIHDISLGKFASIENKWVAKCFHGICYVVLWEIWHWRKRILHASPLDVDSGRQEDIFSSIQRLYLLWISNRCPRTNRQWCGWVSNPRGAEGV